MNEAISEHRAPWTNAYGLARSILALGTLLTLLCNSSDSLFRPLGRGSSELLKQVWIARFSLFQLAYPGRMEAARWLAIAVLAAVIIGWRPRVTGILHWWVSWSFAVTTILIDGGDQVNALITLLLVPVTLTDPRGSHWQASGPARHPLGAQISEAIARSAFVMIALQMSVIYLVAASSKLHAREWLDGTGLYYWFTHPVFGLNASVAPYVLPVLHHPVVVTLSTWGVIGLELVLGALLVAPFSRRRGWLPVALAFHGGIVLVHGLSSFFCAMAAGCLLFLRPYDEPITWFWPSSRLPEPTRLSSTAVGHGQ